MQSKLRPGIDTMVPRAQMVESARKMRDIYAIKPGASLFKREFGYYCLEEWYHQGLDRNADLAEFFDYDEPGIFYLRQLGGCEGEFDPAFEEKIIEDRGEHEVVRDFAGRHVLYFKGRRSGFMPEYLDHPVKDMKTWTENVKWRLDPTTPSRFVGLEERMNQAQHQAGQGLIISQYIVGGYMYLRSLIGPEELLYALHDMPELIHDCMAAWLKLADAVIAIHQKYLTLDEILFDEDICFNHGSLISPEMMQQFILPYYQQLITSTKSRQLDSTRHLYIQIATDGYAVPTIDIYHQGIGMDVMSPFEVASGCDVVEIGKQFPYLIMTGGIDKRILAQSKSAIDKHLAYILPAMKKRGGYIPTCDHGVPAEVSLDNYRHYRKRCVELGS